MGCGIGNDTLGDGRRAPGTGARARRASAVTVLVVGAIVLAGCGLVGDDDAPSSSGQVVMLGDSITHASADEIVERFAGPDDELTIDARPGYTAEEVLGRARTVVDELGDTEAEQVIVNVGTNDIKLALEPSRTMEGITAIVDLFPSARCVHVVTISRQILDFEDPGLSDRVDELNDLIEELADGRDEVRVLDWNEVLDDPPADLETGDLLASDTVHTSPRGEAILADTYIEALDACT